MLLEGVAVEDDNVELLETTLLGAPMMFMTKTDASNLLKELDVVELQFLRENCLFGPSFQEPGSTGGNDGEEETSRCDLDCMTSRSNTSCMIVVSDQQGKVPSKDLETRT